MYLQHLAQPPLGVQVVLSVMTMHSVTIQGYDGTEQTVVMTSCRNLAILASHSHMIVIRTYDQLQCPAIM